MSKSQQLRALFQWHSEYRPDWDDSPDLYAEHGFVPWGKSRRLGLFRQGNFKAYLGVQHVDPEMPGWRIVDAPQARFFVSLFLGRQCITLRTFKSVAEALAWLGDEIDK